LNFFVRFFPSLPPFFGATTVKGDPPYLYQKPGFTPDHLPAKASPPLRTALSQSCFFLFSFLIPFVQVLYLPPLVGKRRPSRKVVTFFPPKAQHPF